MRGEEEKQTSDPSSEREATLSSCGRPRRGKGRLVRAICSPSTSRRDDSSELRIDFILPGEITNGRMPGADLPPPHPVPEARYDVGLTSPSPVPFSSVAITGAHRESDDTSIPTHSIIDNIASNAMYRTTRDAWWMTMMIMNTGCYLLEGLVDQLTSIVGNGRPLMP
jgi:hypothetical protein